MLFIIIGIIVILVIAILFSGYKTVSYTHLTLPTIA